MKTEKFITVIVWATLAVIAYEVYKSVSGSSSSPQGATSLIGSDASVLQNAQAAASLNLLGLAAQGDYSVAGQTQDQTLLQEAEDYDLAVMGQP